MSRPGEEADLWVVMRHDPSRARPWYASDAMLAAWGADPPFDGAICKDCGEIYWTRGDIVPVDDFACRAATVIEARDAHECSREGE